MYSLEVSHDINGTTVNVVAEESLRFVLYWDQMLRVMSFDDPVKLPGMLIERIAFLLDVEPEEVAREASEEYARMLWTIGLVEAHERYPWIEDLV